MNTFVTISQSCPHCYLKKIFSRVQFWSTIPRRRVFAVKWMSCGWDLGGYCSAFPWSSFSENGFLFFFFLHDSKSLLMVCLDSRGSVLIVFSCLTGEALAGDVAQFTKCLPYKCEDLQSIPSTHKKVYILIHSYYSAGGIGRFLEYLSR